MHTYDSMKQTIERREAIQKGAHALERVTGRLQPRPLLSRIVRTRSEWHLTLARLVLGAVMFPHGAQKGFGWFGGSGLKGTMNQFKHGMGIPKPFTLLATAAELVGSICLVTGFMSRIAAVGIITNMTVATVKVHRPQGFFMNWSGEKKGEGYEYHILAIALGLTVLMRGGGALSVDRLLTRSIPGELPA